MLCANICLSLLTSSQHIQNAKLSPFTIRESQNIMSDVSMSDEDPSSEEEDPSSNKDPSRYDHPPNNEDQEERPSPGSPAKSQSSANDADQRLCELP